jgi:hypothetical protein
MDEQDARKVVSHVLSMCKVLGGDVRQMCAERGVPDDLLTALLAEQASWDEGLSKFDWDGSVKRASPERRREKRLAVSIPATFALENKLYRCVVLNMSAGGLLLKFSQQPDLLLSQDDTGKKGMVVLGTEKKSLHGRIVRVLLRDSAREAALSFAG